MAPVSGHWSRSGPVDPSKPLPDYMKQNLSPILPAGKALDPRRGYTFGNALSQTYVLPDPNWVSPQDKFAQDVYLRGMETQNPIQYGNLFNEQFRPAYEFLGNQQSGLQQAQGQIGLAGTQGATSIGTAGQAQAGALAGLGVEGNTAIGTTAANNSADIGQSNINAMTSVANSGMGLYGNLSQVEMGKQRFNALAPMLQGLLSQSGFGQLPQFQPIQYNPMSGYGGVMGTAYDQVGRAGDNAYRQNAGAVRGAYDAVGGAIAGGHQQNAAAMDAAYRNLGQFQNTAYGQNAGAAKQFSNDFANAFNTQAGLMPQMPEDAPRQSGDLVLGGLATRPPQTFDEDAVRYEMEVQRQMAGYGPGPESATYSPDKWFELTRAPRSYQAQAEAQRRLAEIGKLQNKTAQYMPFNPLAKPAVGPMYTPPSWTRDERGQLQSNRGSDGWMAGPQGYQWSNPNSQPPPQWETFQNRYGNTNPNDPVSFSTNRYNPYETRSTTPGVSAGPMGANRQARFSAAITPGPGGPAGARVPAMRRMQTGARR